ncbi:NAD(P)-dependent alcohol dehydrogenase [Parahaliea mediterranea]|uniref:NAD(P)-dependent alcohol dehydrogenase n=1 Tax=Parahaliea mediterranea TaxID=651086 RepID=UPI0019D4B733|nr:NAD(P)-dependent alcohol dehydrogenase [Parahaliea mediterranea]
MKLLRTVFLSLLALLGVGLVVLAFTLSYNVACPSEPAAYNGDRVMRSAIQRCYGSPEVVENTTLPIPDVGPGEILVQVRAASVNPLDWHYLRGEPYFMRLISGIGRNTLQGVGVDFAGTVVEVGSGVTRFQPGDAVYGGKSGAFSDYVKLRADGSVAAMPDNIGYAEAAALPIAAVTALQALRDVGGVSAGDRVLVNGASGGVGTFAVQLARNMGAKVTGVCSTRNLAMVRGLGADEVIDYTQSDYTRSGERWDVIIDAVGNHSPLANRRALASGGTLVMVGAGKGNWVGPLLNLASAVLISQLVDEQLKPFVSGLNGPDLAHLAQLMERGELSPVIDRHYPLSEVREALAYSESGRARGKIIIDVNPYER